MLKKYFFITFILFLVAAYVATSKNRVDSMKTVLNHGKIHDTTRLKLLFAIGEETWLFRYGYWDTIAETAIQKIEEEPRLKLTYQSILAKTYSNIGYILKEQGDPLNALQYYNKALALEITLGHKAGVATCYNNMGYIFKQQGNIPLALDYYKKSLSIREEIGDKRGMSYTLNNIAFIYKSQGEYENAIDYFKKSLELKQQNGDKKGEANGWNNLGLSYYEQKKYDAAINNYLKSISIYNRIEDLSGLSYSFNNLGAVYRSIGSLDSAHTYYQRSLTIRKELNDKKAISESYNNLANVMIDLNNVAQAKEYAQEGYDLAMELGFPELIKNNAEKLYLAEKLLGNYKQSLSMYEQYIEMRDSIQNESNLKATIRHQTQYEFEKAQLVAEQRRNEELRIHNEKLERRNNLQYSAIFIAIIGVFGLTLALGKVQLSPKIAEGLIFFTFLLFFEFLLVLLDPVIEEWSSGQPAYKLLFNAVLAAGIFPLHSFFEQKLKARILHKAR